MTAQIILFVILGAIAIAAAAGMLLSRNAVYSAVFLIMNFAVVAVFYLMLGAPFIAMVQVAVYAGAIMVLFMFVVMLLGAERLKAATDVSMTYRATAGVLVALLLVVGGAAVLLSVDASAPPVEISGEAAEAYGSPASIGELMFSKYVLPIQAVAFLLLAAMIGAVVLTKDDKPPVNVRAMQVARRGAQRKAALEKQLAEAQAARSDTETSETTEAAA